MHEKVLPKGSRELLESLGAIGDPGLRGWTLAGGTGLALTLGHRVSEDFDFFRCDEMDADRLADILARLKPYETLQQAEHTLTVLVQGVKLSFFRARDPFLFDAAVYRFFDVADRRDIAIMKLVAIGNRGARKDFVDLYMILRSGVSLRDCLEWLPRKYGASRVNAYHILRSLTWFEDAEQEPMPRMLVPLDWGACKGFLQRQAAAVL